MTLFEKIEKILFNEGIGVNDFVEITGFSKGLYYDIKNGKKTELKPAQAKIISDSFPNSRHFLFEDKSEKVFLSNKNTSKEVYLEKDGVKVYLPELIDHFVKNKDAYLEQSEYLQLYLNKHIELGVKARLEELGYTVKIVERD